MSRILGTHIAVLDLEPALQKEVMTIIDPQMREAHNQKVKDEGNPENILPSAKFCRETTDKNPVVYYPSWMWAEIISRNMDVDDIPLYYVETLNVNASTAAEVVIFDTNEATSGKSVTNNKTAGECGSDEVYWIQKIGIQYDSSMSVSEINRAEYEGFLVIEMDGEEYFRERLGNLGGLGNAELTNSDSGANQGTATADKIYIKKGDPTVLTNWIKLPSDTAYTIKYVFEGSVATALAGDICAVLFTTRGKVKGKGQN